MIKEPGQLAYETRFQDIVESVDRWQNLPRDYKAIWARVERACFDAAYEMAAKAMEGERSYFENMASRLVSDDFAKGYREASDHIAAALRALKGEATIPSPPATLRGNPSEPGRSDAQGA